MRSRWIISIVVCLLLLTVAKPASAETVLADLRSNYLSTALGNSTAFFNGGSGLADTFGTGRWNYYDSSTFDLSGTQTLLTWKNVNSVRNTSYAGSASLDLPGVLNGTLISGAGQGAPAANELAIHPGNAAGARKYLGLRWTAGAGEAGNVHLTGRVHKLQVAEAPDSTHDGVDFKIFLNGVQQHAATVAAQDGIGNSYDLPLTVAAGSTIDFLFSPRNEYYGDHSGISARITQTSPAEPHVLARLREDFRLPAAFGQTTGFFNAGTGLSDTRGTGRWNFYECTTANPELGSRGMLDYQPARGARLASYSGSEPNHELPGILDAQLIINEAGPGPTEVAMHPGVGATPNFLLTSWTAGPDEGGMVQVVGRIRKLQAGGDGVDFHIFQAGLSRFSTVLTGSNTTGVAFDFLTEVAPGQRLDFVLGPNGSNFNTDNSGLEVTILASSVPEPLTLTLGLLASTGLGRYLRRRRGGMTQ